MKKALALVLALVLALSMAVSAFAAGVVLIPADKPTADKPIEIAPVTFADDEKVYVYEGGEYYFQLDDSKEFENVKLTTNGNVTAELVKYDPAKMIVDGVEFVLYNPAKKVYASAVDTKGVVTEVNDVTDALVYDLYAGDPDENIWGAKDDADIANDKAEAEVWVVVPTTNVYIVKFVVADNYSAAYTKGTIKIDAIEVDGKTKTPVTGTITIINDVVIFEYEHVKYAASKYADEYALLTNTKGTATTEVKGYSDYETYVKGYDLTTNVVQKYDYSALRNISNPYVVSTTAFRAIAGKGLLVSTPSEGFVVDIKAVQAGQQGVNFKWYNYIYRNAAGLDTSLATTLDKHVKSVDFGFYGDQVIKGDFTVTATPGITWFQLRELFEVKVEEDDIISYYLLKDGKLVKEYKIDYMTIDDTEEVEIELDLKDTTLGQYTLALEVPAAGEAAESNPNTGAESVVGVVAALAVVSLASAAAVSLKK